MKKEYACVLINTLLLSFVLGTYSIPFQSEHGITNPKFKFPVRACAKGQLMQMLVPLLRLCLDGAD